jgi:hypothetical protein
MATNNNGNLLDTAGEVAIDFVWGNIPMQPNDVRPNAVSAVGTPGRLDPLLDNHIIALSGWGGYPLFTANSAGEDVAGPTDYVLVPSVIGLTTALATDAMKDASLVPTTAAAAANSAKTVTALQRDAGTTVLQVAVATHGYSIGQKVTLSGLSADFNGTYTVTTVPSANQINVTTTATTAYNASSLSGSVVAVAGTIKTQSVAAGANNTSVGAAVTITPWAAAS